MSDPPRIIVGAVVLSLVVAPAGLTVYLAGFAPPGDGSTARLLGVTALLPGVLMGAAGLWTAARG